MRSEGPLEAEAARLVACRAA